MDLQERLRSYYARHFESNAGGRDNGCACVQVLDRTMYDWYLTDYARHLPHLPRGN